MICYKPVDQEGCFLRKMEKPDYDNVHSLLRESTHKVTFQHVRTERSCLCDRDAPHCIRDT